MILIEATFSSLIGLPDASWSRRIPNGEQSSIVKVRTPSEGRQLSARYVLVKH